MADAWLNKIISGARVIVENTIAGVKRCRIVKDVFRNTKEGFSDLVMDPLVPYITCGWIVVILCLSSLYTNCRQDCYYG